jgi:hypothetical protein
VPETVSNSILEAKLIWQYLGNKPPIHVRRTFGHLDDTENEHGVHGKSGLPKTSSYGKVLMVDQLGSGLSTKGLSSPSFCHDSRPK